MVSFLFFWILVFACWWFVEVVDTPTKDKLSAVFALLTVVSAFVGLAVEMWWRGGRPPISW